MEKFKILFVCTHNSARSKIAEALAKHILKEKVEVASCGTEPAGVHPLTLKVLEEIGVKPPELKSRHINEFRLNEFDLVVTVCSDADKKCPRVEGVRKIHVSFADPSRPTCEKSAQLDSFRKVRDSIKKWIEEYLKPLIMASFESR